MTSEAILKVAVNVPLSRPFDYSPPAADGLPARGCRVVVPFGRRREIGVVLATSDSTEVADTRLKRAERAIDAEPLLSDDDLWLIRFTSDYYHHPIGEVCAAALPVLLRQGRDLVPQTERFVATDAGRGVELNALGKRAPRQAELLATLVDAGGNGLDAETLTETVPNWRRVAAPLEDKGLIDRFTARADEFEDEPAHDPEPGPELNPEQQAAVAAVRSATGFAAFVLDGVTGSGKTEVYLHLIGDVLAAGGQALVLVPEIGLTPQLVARLRTRLGVEPAVLHSGLSDVERLTAWRRARSGDAQLVVGTRSAVFAPLPKLGLIVVDEEHDHSYKQQEGLRYSARDLAIARANRRRIPVVLGSATPTIEMLRHARDGHYAHLRLPRRAGGARPPSMRIVDLSRTRSEDGLSDVLVSAIDHHLSAGGQALLFLNRRGFAPTLICGACGHVAECRRCDSRLTVHARAGELRCHHCGVVRPIDARCGECGGEVRALGAGTERIEDALRTRFAGRTITRIDSDSTQRRGAIDSALRAATGGDADILVGTQMLSKGHHFPKLTLVGVINADQGLFGTDFRSDERMAQSIVQVAGRAGRERTAGEVLIQTAFPAHPFWRRLIDRGYDGVAGEILAERAETEWPPFSYLALIASSAHKRRDAHAFLDSARAMLADFDIAALRVLGPVDAVMARRAGRYRAQLLLQSADRQSLHRALGRLRPLLESDRAARRVRWSIDVDPIELF